MQIPPPRLFRRKAFFLGVFVTKEGDVGGGFLEGSGFRAEGWGGGDGGGGFAKVGRRLSIFLGDALLLEFGSIFDPFF